jgi:hypothetical protein
MVHKKAFLKGSFLGTQKIPEQMFWYLSYIWNKYGKEFYSNNCKQKITAPFYK